MFPEKSSMLQQGLNLFRPKPEPKELVRKWQSMLRTETRRVDTQIRESQRCAVRRTPQSRALAAAQARLRPRTGQTALAGLSQRADMAFKP